MPVPLGVIATSPRAASGGGGGPVTTSSGWTYAGGSMPTTVAVPAGGAAGDHYALVACIQDEDSTPPTLSAPGFTHHGTVTGTASPGSYWAFQLLTRLHDGTEGSHFAISGAATWRYFSAGLVHGWTGATAPVLGAISAAVSGTTPCPLPGVTVPSDDALLVAHLASWDSNASAAIAGWTLQTLGEYSAAPVFTRAAPAGASGVASCAGGWTARLQGWQIAIGN